jgi:hypothetical protein
MKKLFVLFFVCLQVVVKSQPANNAIFNGGNADGFTTSGNNASSNNIFLGSVGDGFANASNNAVSNSIFLGGNGDGFSNVSNNAAANIIYIGGAGDGWSNNTNNAISNNIFLGSIGDGWSNDGNNILPNSIFNGGVGDGWSSVVIPLAPLPVELLSFTGFQKDGKHLLNWKTSFEINTSHFEIEHSTNSQLFTSIAKIIANGNSNAILNYDFTNQKPFIGNNFYRLKLVDKDGSFIYSNIILLKVLSGYTISVYPNPTADILNINLGGNLQNKPILISLIDASGKIIMQKQVLQNNQNITLNVAHLPKATYSLLLINNEGSNTIRFMKQ